MAIDAKRKKIIAHIMDTLRRIEPAGINADKMKTLLENMGTAEFSKYMQGLKDGSWVIPLEAPNLITRLKIEDIYKAAEAIGCKLFHRLRMKEPSTGRTIVTTEEYPVLRMTLRRPQQTIEKKMALSDSDRKLDAMTGQVTGDDQASAVSREEFAILYNRGNRETMREFALIRGGNPELYAQFRQELEETGAGHVDTHDPANRTRVAQTTDTLFRGMHLATTLPEN